MALEAVIAEALKLSAEDRTELVARLLESLDDNADPGHEAAWTEVIDRRMKDITEERVGKTRVENPRPGFVFEGRRAVDYRSERLSGCCPGSGVSGRNPEKK